MKLNTEITDKNYLYLKYLSEVTGLSKGSLIDSMIVNYIDEHINTLKQFNSWKVLCEFLDKNNIRDQKVIPVTEIKIT